MVETEKSQLAAKKVERPPILDRIVSEKMSAEEKEEIIDELVEKFTRQEIDAIKEGEVELTPRQKELVAEANRLVAKILKNAGIEPKIDIQIFNVHLVRSRVFDRYIREKNSLDENLAAVTSIEDQGILIKEKEYGELEFLDIIIHEILHANSFISLQRVDTELSQDPMESKELPYFITARRMGLRIQRTERINGKKVLGQMRFNELDEALIEKLTVDLMRNFDIQISPDLKNDFKKSEKLRRIIIEYLEDVFKTKKDLIREAEFSELGKVYMALRWQAVFLPRAEKFLEEYERTGDSLVLEDAISFYSSLETTGGIPHFAYGFNRIMLEKLIDGIFKRNKDKFNSPIEVIKLFMRALFEGRLLPLVRVVEGTFGKGAFQMLGEGIDITADLSEDKSESLNPKS